MQRVTVLLGIYAVMALSNAIVPVLPAFAAGSPAIQGAIYSAYFFGAFLTVLPAGMAADRIGAAPLVRAGLLLTVISGVLTLAAPGGLVVLAARGLEGVGAGLFVATALAWVNSRPDHLRLSGLFFAALNLGLVTGLLATGLLEAVAGIYGGIAFYTALAVIPAVMSIGFTDRGVSDRPRASIRVVLRDYLWLYFSTIILLGATGVVTALYPNFTGSSATLLSVQIGAMSTATMITSLFAARLLLKPIPTIRASAVLMAVAVVFCYISPPLGNYAVVLGFVALGGLAGFCIIAQTAFLAETGLAQGTVMGIFNTASYAGMAFLPFLAGLIAQYVGFLAAFAVIAGFVLSVSVFIGRCRCPA
jgi:MFS family permease